MKEVLLPEFDLANPYERKTSVVPLQLGLDHHKLEIPGHKRLEIEFGVPIREIIA